MLLHCLHVRACTSTSISACQARDHCAVRWILFRCLGLPETQHNVICNGLQSTQISVTCHGPRSSQGICHVIISHKMMPNAYTSEEGVWLPPANTSGATQRGFVAATEEAAEEASMTLDRLKSATCKHAKHSRSSDLVVYWLQRLRSVLCVSWQIVLTTAGSADTN